MAVAKLLKGCEMLMRLIAITLLLLLFVSITPCSASWLLFHKPEFKGKIVDIETKEPIEGAVVVAIYRKQVIGVGDSVTMDFDAREAVTDKDGSFRIPSYTTLIQPLSWSIPTEFIIFKPGYVCDGTLGREDDFSGTGTVSDREYTASWNSNLKYRISRGGIVMLRKVTGKNRLESYNNFDSRISLYQKELPVINTSIKSEDEIAKVLERQWRKK